jgi:hypothetical protein
MGEVEAQRLMTNNGDGDIAPSARGISAGLALIVKLQGRFLFRATPLSWEMKLL